MSKSIKTLLLFWLAVIMVIPVAGQFNRSFFTHTCTHHCSHAKVNHTKTGIYDQDPRVHHYDIKFYGLDLQVNPWTTFIAGSTRVVAEITQPATRNFVLELTDVQTVEAVMSNGQSLAFVHQDHVLDIDLGEEKEPGQMVDLEVFYAGEPQPQGFFSGIQTATNSFGDPVLWTLSEPHNARVWFPCKQVLSDKADSVYVYLSVPQGFMAASNGLLYDVIELENDRVQYQWHSYYPIAYYLISLAVANYQEYSFMAPLAQGVDSVLVQNFIYNYPQVLEAQKPNIDMTIPMMQLMSELWGNYPFASEKYGHAQAPMGGGMEHQTISTMGYFGFDITAHELAHHWFGNNVTCATWSDIWINEGFASYAEYLSREFILGPTYAQDWMQAVHSNVKSQPGGSVYIPPIELTDVWRIFNGRLSYRKGAAILHQLRFEINDDPLFFQVMEEFQDIFADDVATGDDFRSTVDLVTGQSWEWFFDQWYYGEGFPTYQITWWQEDGKLVIQSSQSTSAALPDFFEGSLEFLVMTEGQEQLVRVYQDKVLQQFEFIIEGDVESIVFDPRGFMLKNYTVWDSTNIESPVIRNIKVFPNPFTEDFNIEYPESWHNAIVILTDLYGKVILEQRLNEHNGFNHLSGLASGVYFLTLFSDSGEKETIRLIKN